MNNIIKRFDAHLFHKSDSIIEFLENMALKGYKLNKIDKYFWYYEKITPIKINYDMYYSDEPTTFEKWDFITSYKKIHFYTSEEKDDLIVNNEKSKFEIISNNVKNDYIFILILAFLTLLCLLISTLNFTLKNPLDSLGSNLPLLIISLLLMEIPILMQLFSYFNWYFISKKNISQGKNCHICKKQNIINIIFIFSPIIISTIFIFATTFTILNNKTENSELFLKKIEYSNLVSRDVELYLDEIPLKLQYLGFNESDYYSYHNSKSANSLFVEYNLYHQSKLHFDLVDLEEEEQNLIHVDYCIIDVKFTPMFNWILNYLIDVLSLNINSNTTKYHQFVLKEHDLLDEFYQINDGDNDLGQYVMCKNNKIVTMEFYDYVLSDKQLELVIEKLF